MNVHENGSCERQNGIERKANPKLGVDTENPDELIAQLKGLLIFVIFVHL
jgi:hypothetical protein